MAITIEKTEIEDLVIIRPHQFKDDRGLYKKYYEINDFAGFGITEEVTESSDIYSCKGALRGLHYQDGNSQSKLLHVISGILYDVVIDLRTESATFGKVHTELLKAEEHKALYVPKRFAHGFIALTENTIFSYQCSGKYEPDKCGGILWNDPILEIKWPLNEYGIENVICTEKDSSWPTFEEYCRDRGL